jgi:general secretion pathway protein N
MAWIGLVLGLVLALLLFAPARWLAQGIEKASNGQLRLINASGTVWRGQADLVFSGGEGSRTRTVLPRGLHWQLAPRLDAGMPALGIRLHAPCCTPKPIHLQARPRWGGGELKIAASSSQWPADMLSGLGTPWNTLRMEGQLALETEGMTLRWTQGRANMEGAMAIDALDIASRLSTLRPLGSYRLELQALEDGHSASLDLQTLRGDLQLQGSGQWVGGRLRFEGEARAAPGREVTLTNLLNIIGRRDGSRSLVNIG